MKDIKKSKTMQNDENPKILIDRYGNPLGTPPEIYKDTRNMLQSKYEGDTHTNSRDILFQMREDPYKFRQNYSEDKRQEFSHRPEDFNKYRTEFQDDKRQEYPIPYTYRENEYPYDAQGKNNPDIKYFTPDQYYTNFENSFLFEGNGEQPLYVNVHQYNTIKKRKLRRDYLDSLMKTKNKAGYLHESRHRHAMNRLRAPSGRFLTKEEAAEQRMKNNGNL
ncbi:putative CCAAT-binding transcription factor [Hamiltosporidium magnivora]|uniref:Transcriptional activator HAP2 n=1 Tax=Hamiltosporidium magnivora TaxID=148818 RepID=A0A4Q9LFY8_9MICR|nr:putative CCAAT-binding transcription factor [Hamiltosporidium magnivora]TBU08984.1 putative CCAAT-binding transcription factor [Hamiltosporidium magnivora]